MGKLEKIAQLVAADAELREGDDWIEDRDLAAKLNEKIDLDLPRDSVPVHVLRDCLDLDSFKSLSPQEAQWLGLYLGGEKSLPMRGAFGQGLDKLFPAGRGGATRAALDAAEVFTFKGSKAEAEFGQGVVVTVEEIETARIQASRLAVEQGKPEIKLAGWAKREADVIEAQRTFPLEEGERRLARMKAKLERAEAEENTEEKTKALLDIQAAEAELATLEATIPRLRTVDEAPGKAGRRGKQ